MKTDHSITKSLILVFLFCFNLVLLAKANLIDQTCKRTPNYDLCVSTLKQNPESSNADVKGLASIMVDAVLAKATDTLNFIQDLLKHAGGDQHTEQALAFCAEQYIPLVKFSIPQAINALLRGRFGFVDYSMYDAGNQADACAKKLDPTSPLVERNKVVEALSGVAAAILKQLVRDFEQKRGECEDCKHELPIQGHESLTHALQHSSTKIRELQVGDSTPMGRRPEDCYRPIHKPNSYGSATRHTWVDDPTTVTSPYIFQRASSRRLEVRPS